MGDGLLARLLGPLGAPDASAELAAWWDLHQGRIDDVSDTATQAAIAGLNADRVSFAFIGGYRAALRQLLPQHRDVMALCATESGGNHPRAIGTTLREDGDTLVLSGEKTWVTGGSLARRLLVMASRGSDDAGRNRLVGVIVDADAEGVSVQSLPATPFVPEVPHAAISLRQVRVAPEAVVQGDGYADLLKPFRTIEDLHVHVALLAYLVGVGRRNGWDSAFVERSVAVVLAGAALCREDAKSAAVHIATAGLLGQTLDLVAEAERLWDSADDPEFGRFLRDKALLKVAGKARQARRQRAWQTLAADG